MIRFIINNYELVLPEDFSITLIKENPVITRSGEFSLDINTSLLEGNNAKAFNHINRLNNMAINKTGECIMILDNEQFFGLYIILGITDSTVQWQFVAGNSHLNFITKNDKKIWELDFGVESTVDFSRALNSVQNPGYTTYNNFVCAPVKCGELILNDYYFDDNFDSVVNCVGVNNIVIQPYLLYYINKLPQLLGYTMNENVLLNDERAKYLFMLNSVKSLKYSDFLPDISISEFIDAIERFFNVTFLLNPIKKEFNILKSNDYIRNLNVVKLENVIDSYENDIDDDIVNLNFFCSKIAYSNLSNTNFMKYNKLNDDVLSKLEIKEYNNLTEITTFLTGKMTSHYGKPYLYVDNETGDQYMYDHSVNFSYPNITFGYSQQIARINKFRNVEVNSQNLGELNLLISPASIHIHEVQYKYKRGTVEVTLFAKVQIGETINSNFVDVNKKFSELVESGVNNLPRLSYIESAYYRGNIQFNDDNPTLKYFFVWVDNKADAAYQQNLVLPYQNCTFRLYGENGIVNQNYSNTVILDAKSVLRFDFLGNPKLTLNNIYEYNNQHYIPIKFEHKISKNRSSLTGYFYRIDS